MGYRSFPVVAFLLFCLIHLLVPIQVFAQEGVVADPASLSFGSLCIGEAETLTVTLTNYDPSTVTINNYIFVSGAVWDEFYLVSPPSFPYSLPVGGTVTFTVAFSPPFDSMLTETLRFYTSSTTTPYVEVLLYGDGYGGVCEPDDSDSDGVEDSSDNCPLVPNGPDLGTCTGEEAGIKCHANADCPSGELCSLAQEDTDRDGVGDACDLFDLTTSPEKPDADDTVTFRGKYNRYVPKPEIKLIIDREIVKECEAKECEDTGGPFPEGASFKAAYRGPDEEWEETEESFLVRYDETDWDNDGVLNAEDNCFRVPNGPDLGTCTAGNLGISCTSDSDCGSDGFCSMNQEETPICLDPTPAHGCDRWDWNGDGVGDACDDDVDNDGCLDEEDPYPQSPSSDVEMGNSYFCRESGFGDGVGEDCDNCPDDCNPDQSNVDGDAWGDVCDNCPQDAVDNQWDTDFDGRGDFCDNCSYVSNPDQEDTDLDGYGNACDNDDDGDGCLDEEDEFPTVFSPDTDGDGHSNDCDDDDDNDGHLDIWDDFPLDPNEWEDWDDDGMGNNVDLCDEYAHWDNTDTDGDGEGDACDCDDILQLGDETGVDCGGACPPCLECTWCGSNIEPIRLRGVPDSGIMDIVFVPHKSWEGRIDEFKEYIIPIIRNKYMKLDDLTYQDPNDPPFIEPIPEDFRDRFNFYFDISGGYGIEGDCNGILPGEDVYSDYLDQCAALGEEFGSLIEYACLQLEKPDTPHFWGYAPFTDVAAIVGDYSIADIGGCGDFGPPTGTGNHLISSIERCWEEIGCGDFTDDTLVHETGHNLFGLIDEYDGDTGYNLRTQDLDPLRPYNVWRDFGGTDGDPGQGMEWCETFAIEHGLDPDGDGTPETGCRQFTNFEGLPYVRFDVDGDDIMQRSWRNNSIFREADTWVITHVFNTWPESETRGILTYFHFDGNYFNPLGSEVVKDHPDIYEKVDSFTVELLSATGGLLKIYGIHDPRYNVGDAPFFTDEVVFPLLAAFEGNVRYVNISDTRTGELMGRADLGPAIYEFCSEGQYEDPHCQPIDLDGNSIPDIEEPVAWSPENAVAKICDPEMRSTQCILWDLDHDGILNDVDNCIEVENADQLDTDQDGYGDSCDNCLERANPDQADSNGNGVGDACEFVSVSIDIKPGSYPNCMNINSKGVIPVAILGSADFDVSTVDISTLSFAGLQVRIKGNDKTQCAVEDVSGDFTTPEGAPDGYPDLVCQFIDEALLWEPGDGLAALTGQLYDGRSLEGTDEICIVP